MSSSTFSRTAGSSGGSRSPSKVPFSVSRGLPRAGLVVFLVCSRFSRHIRFHGCFPLSVDLLRQKFGLGAATATGAFQELLQGRRRGQ
eukprot:2817023-Amphidinium_carterae.1